MQPPLHAPFYNVWDISTEATDILKEHAEEIMNELTIVENLGLLDWGTVDSKVKVLLNEFQQ